MWFDHRMETEDGDRKGTSKVLRGLFLGDLMVRSAEMGIPKRGAVLRGKTMHLVRDVHSTSIRRMPTVCQALHCVLSFQGDTQDQPGAVDLLNLRDT